MACVTDNLNLILISPLLFFWKLNCNKIIQKNAIFVKLGNKVCKTLLKLESYFAIVERSPLQKFFNGILEAIFQNNWKPSSNRQFEFEIF